jgi:hypothetical protein
MTRLPRLLLAAVVWQLAMLLAMGPAAAITNGQPDAGRHPYVGLMVAHDARRRPAVAVQRIPPVTDGLSHGWALHRAAGSPRRGLVRRGADPDRP